MKQKELLIISVVIFLTVIAWIIADLVHIASARQVNIENNQVTETITTSVDTEIINLLKERL